MKQKTRPAKRMGPKTAIGVSRLAPSLHHCSRTQINCGHDAFGASRNGIGMQSYFEIFDITRRSSLQISVSTFSHKAPCLILLDILCTSSSSFADLSFPSSETQPTWNRILTPRDSISKSSYRIARPPNGLLHHINSFQSGISRLCQPYHPK